MATPYKTSQRVLQGAWWCVAWCVKPDATG